ncbi:MAG: hypothetical protein N5P05_002268 [Chroococcopsis gigantea SAG 12.99]|jgi:hypothetical protein|nr:hypothetical protein [Chlorogloea purpurea SAG 13.99]MDV3000662.1 hypothetical protein [Chroococcopsis gigantea SAG 12.99]
MYSLILYGEGQARTDLWSDLYGDLGSWLHKFEIESFEVLEAFKEALIDKAASGIYEQVWKILSNWLGDRLWSELKSVPEAYSAFQHNFIDADFEWASYAGLFDFLFMS